MIYAVIYIMIYVHICSVNSDNNEGARCYYKTFADYFRPMAVLKEIYLKNFDDYKMNMTSVVLLKMVISQFNSDLTATMKNECWKI